MATKITVVLEDDLDGGPADETVRFAIGSTNHEIDLNASNAAAFRRLLARYSEDARRAGSRPAGAVCGARPRRVHAAVCGGDGRAARIWRPPSRPAATWSWRWYRCMRRASLGMCPGYLGAYRCILCMPRARCGLAAAAWTVEKTPRCWRSPGGARRQASGHQRAAGQLAGVTIPYSWILR
jgi:Lsr2